MTSFDSKTKLLNERLQFVDLDDAQRTALARSLPVISASLDTALNKFYAKARANPETARFFASEAHVQGAKARQAKHWELIASGRFDAQYVDAVTTIGKTHARLGLEPRWYIGGYALIIESILKSVIESHLKGFLHRNKAKEIGTDVAAVVKAAMVDMDYAISVYLDALQEERERSEAERQVLNGQQEEALSALEDCLKRLADGDLTAVITSELAPQFASLRSNFNAALGKLDQTFGAIVGLPRRRQTMPANWYRPPTTWRGARSSRRPRSRKRRRHSKRSPPFPRKRRHVRKRRGGSSEMPPTRRANPAPSSSRRWRR